MKNIFSKSLKNTILLLLGTMLGLTGIGLSGLDYAVGKAYAEVENVRVSGDLREGIKVRATGRLHDEKTETSEITEPTTIKFFEYEGETFEIKSYNVKDNKIVFSKNFSKEANRTYVSKGGVGVANFEIVVADINLRTGVLTNVKRVTKTKDKDEAFPAWTDDGNIAYVEANIGNPHESTCHVMDIEGNILRDISLEEYAKLTNLPTKKTIQTDN